MRDAVDDRVLEERFETLTDAICEFSETSADYPALLQTITRRTAQALDCFCTLRLISEDGLTLRPEAVFDADPVAAETLRVLAGEARPVQRLEPVWTALSAGKPYAMANHAVDSILAQIGDPVQQEAARRLEICQLVVFPMRARGNTIGALSVGRRGRTAPRLTEREMALASSLAHHAALAVANGRLHAARERELEERRRMTFRLAVLADAAEEYSAATSDHERLLATIARRLGEVVGDMCFIHAVDADRRWLESTAAIHHRDPELLPSLRAAVGACRIAVGDGVIGRVASKGQPVLLPIVSADQLESSLGSGLHALVGETDPASLVCVPLLTDGRVLGTITVVRSGDPTPFTQDDLRLVQDLAAHAALAIANTRLLVSIRDAEKALSHTEAQLRQAQKMEAVGRLAGGVAHDFNNLLSVILSYACLLLDELPATDPRREDIDEIRKAGDRAADLTRQLLAFSRQQVIEPRVLDLNEIVGGMEKMIRRLIGEDIELRAVCAPDLGRVRADPGHVEQIVMNLVVNARDAMPSGGMLTIETQNVELDGELGHEDLGVPPGSYVMLAVSDNGVGMDRATQERIFEPFFTTKELGKGTGLGLSTVFGIVKQGGGHIFVYSEVGKGSTFKIYFPRTDEKDARARDAIRVASLRGDETILLVEDEDQLRLVAGGILRRNGYTVLEARNAAEATAAAAKHEGEIDLLLTDVVMPRTSGRELALELTAARPQMRVLYMSGYTVDAIVHHHRLDPGVALLQKPITPDLLLRRVREVLEAQP